MRVTAPATFVTASRQTQMSLRLLEKIANPFRDPVRRIVELNRPGLCANHNFRSAFHSPGREQKEPITSARKLAVS